MSKNYDQIATVDIDIATPIVDDTSFDNLLIMGPAPKGESQAPDVGVYSSIAEVEDAGFVTSGDGADPVGVAARVAFSQSPPRMRLEQPRRSRKSTRSSRTPSAPPAMSPAARFPSVKVPAGSISFWKALFPG